ncbi:MAG: hypothetical protein U0271_34325 [Polyangiaceae bacterium]
MLALTACGSAGFKQKVSLSYAGDDARDTTDELSSAISEAGMAPLCKNGKFCKFDYKGQGSVHFKLTKSNPTLVIHIDGELPDEERSALEQKMTSLGQEIWTKAAEVSVAKEAEQKRVAAEERKHREEMELERERIASAERVETERLRAESAPVAGTTEGTTTGDQAPAAPTKVTDSIQFEPKSNGGAALKVEQPEGAVCNTQSDNADSVRSLEVPFQIEATPGAFYTVDCALPYGLTWRKKVQAKERFVTTIVLGMQ